MKKMSLNIAEASVYVGTYKKYNEGSLFGKWLHLSNYANRDQFYEACAELHSDEEDPEFMFQDYEHIPEQLICECWISESVFEIIDAIEEMTRDHREPFFIWCNNGHRDLIKEDIYDLIKDFENDYIGDYNSEEDFARELVDQRSDLSQFARDYFDYEA